MHVHMVRPILSAMKYLKIEGQYIFFFICFIFVRLCFSCSSSSIYSTAINKATLELRNYTRISEQFRTINRRDLTECPDSSPYVYINISSRNPTLSDDEYVTVNVGGVLKPSDRHWVAMLSPAHDNISSCPLDALLYEQTGDFSKLPLLCHYPVKAQYVRNDPGYLNCSKKECQKYDNGTCIVSTCGGSLSFHVINIRTDIEFAFFAAGFETPCLLKRSSSIEFSNPRKPLYGHLSSTDSSGTSMRLTWVSGDKAPQQVQFGGGKSVTSEVTTFSQNDMCSKLQSKSSYK
ncbi:hypothetical protein Leryth_023931 [Lithospermum erythrorhizon]|nr:hypothetical protein Leryth_023931 [Lithospermum erythrorhizon]